MEQQQQKRPISLDWDSLLDKDDAPPPELVVKPMASDQPPPSSVDGLERLTDHELEESIKSKKRTLQATGKCLPDGGAKLRATIKTFEEELSRRVVKPLSEEVNKEQKKARQTATSSNAVGVSPDLRQENSSSQSKSQSSFASCFVKKIEDDTNSVAFRKEMSHFKPCNNQAIRDNGRPKGRKRHRSSSRQLPFQHASNLSKRDTSNDDKSYRATSALSSLRNIRRNLPRCNPKEKDASQAIQSDGSRSRK
ncbi:ubiquitin-like-specific protease 1D isoform X2, partial [Sesbania bispinosa]